MDEDKQEREHVVGGGDLGVSPRSHSLTRSLARFSNSPMQQTVVGQSDRSIDEAHQVPLGHAISAEHIH